MRARIAAFLTVTAAVVLIGAIVTGASAGNAHFAGHPAQPSFIDNGTTLTTNVDVAGLGNFNTQLNVSAQGRATGNSTCANPGTKQTQPGGQNPAGFPITTSGTTAIPAADIKNGRTQISVTTIPPVSPITITGAPDCPNAGWTETVTITNVSFTSASVTIKQDTNNNNSYSDEAVALAATCTFSPATVNGAVPAASVHC